MIDNLNISYNKGGLSFIISINTTDDNLPYNLSDMFAEIIKQSDANEEIVIDNLTQEFGYNKEGDKQ